MKNQKKNDNAGLVVLNYPEKKHLNIQQYKNILPDCPSCQKQIGLCLIKVVFGRIVKLLLINENVNLIKKSLGKLLIFLLNYHLQLKRL